MAGNRKFCGVIALWLFVLVAIASPAEAQIDKRKKPLFTCFNIPDPPAQPSAAFSPPNVACAIRSDVVVPRAASAFAVRSLGINSPFLTANPFGSNANWNLSNFASRRACAALPTTVYYTAPNTPYPASNLGYASSASFNAPRDVNLPITPNRNPPTNIIINNTVQPPAPVLGYHPTHHAGGDRAISDAFAQFKQNKQAAREIVAQENAAPPPVAPAPDPDFQQIESLLDRGDNLFRKGAYSLAREEYTRALVIAGEDAGVRIPFGMTEFAMGRFEDASRAMRQAAAAQPPLDPTSIDLRQAYTRSGEFDRQVVALEQYLARKPFDADALFLLGFIKACTDNTTGARAVFDKYTALKDADPAVLPFINRLRNAR